MDKWLKTVKYIPQMMKICMSPESVEILTK
jgi:hypothetical protein